MLGCLLICFIYGKSQEYGDINNLDKKNGFKSITLGDSVSNKEKYKFLGDGADETIFYDVINEELKIGEIPLKSISVSSFKGQVASVFVVYDHSKGYLIKDVLNKAYGLYTDRPNRYMDKYDWEGRKVKIHLNYDSSGKDGVMMIISKDFDRLIQEFRNSKTKKAINDL